MVGFRRVVIVVRVVSSCRDGSSVGSVVIDFVIILRPLLLSLPPLLLPLPPLPLPITPLNIPINTDSFWLLIKSVFHPLIAIVVVAVSEV